MKRARNRCYEFDHPGLIISDLSLAIAAAKIGGGVALVPSVPVQVDIEVKRLVTPSELSLEMKKDYMYFYPNARAEHPMQRDFLDYTSAIKTN